MSNLIYIGTDGGATTSKVGAVRGDGTPVSTRLLQSATGSAQGPDAVVRSWVDAVDAYLRQHDLHWDQVGGVGLAVPGPFQRYGVFDRSANLPPEFEGFDVYAAYGNALAERAGRAVSLIVGNDGNMGGIAEAQHARGETDGTVVLLAPGSGLGCAYIDRTGLALDGDAFAGMEAGHLPAPLHLLDVPAYPCGCGRTWGCVEVYTSLAGLPFLLEARLPKYADHELARSSQSLKEKAFGLRGLAQQDDPLALEIFDLQARALGLHVATLAMVLDPTFFVIGGGLMDPEATTTAFRERYLGIVRLTARDYLWLGQRDTVSIVPAALGDLSQAIGAGLAALYQQRVSST
jgi:glucokinase